MNKAGTLHVVFFPFQLKSIHALDILFLVNGVKDGLFPFSLMIEGHVL